MNSRKGLVLALTVAMCLGATTPCVVLAASCAVSKLAGTVGVYDNNGVDVSSTAIRCSEVGKPVFTTGFADASSWDLVSYGEKNCLKLEYGGSLGNALALTVTKTNNIENGRFKVWDTYWVMRTKRLRVFCMIDRKINLLKKSLRIHCLTSVA